MLRLHASPSHLMWPLDGRVIHMHVSLATAPSGQAEEQARQQAQLATLSKAATMLQKMWRGKVARREMERKKAGSRGKKGKKGGKGGKGKKKK